MELKQTRMERFALLREQIQQEIALEQVLLEEETTIQNYLLRFNKIDSDYFYNFVATINQEWDLLNPQLHQDHSKDFINLENRYQINQYLADIRSKYNHELNENFNLQEILKKYHYHHSFEDYFKNIKVSKYQNIIDQLENSSQELQNKITQETKLMQHTIQKYQQEWSNKKNLRFNDKPLTEVLSSSSMQIDEKFNQLVTRFNRKKFTFNWLGWLAVFTIFLLIIFLVAFIILVVRIK